MIDHHWPNQQIKHLFGPWMAQDKKTKRRVCVHPDCNEVEEMDVSKI